MAMMGVYEIYCTSSGKRYIGSSSDIHKRWEQHINSLKNNSHHNYYLQQAWKMYGEDNFVFCILDKVYDKKDLFKIEEKYIKKFKFYDLYNILKKPGYTPKRLGNWSRKSFEKRQQQQEEQEYAWKAK